jgi:penicillin-binding protein 1B
MPSRPASKSRRSAQLSQLTTSFQRWLTRGTRRARILKISALAIGIPLAAGLAIATVFWVSYGHMIDKRLGGGEERPVPRIFGRPFELRQGQGLSPLQLEERLNDVGYAERPKPDEPGQFAMGPNLIVFIPRPTGREAPQPVRVEFSRSASPVVSKLVTLTGKPIPTVTLEPPLLTAFAPGEKRRYTPLASIPRWMVDAVIAIEDRRFFEHPGVDPIGAMGALITNLRGNKPYLVGGSTLTQQIVKNTFLTPAKTLRRKLQEQFMALVLDSRFTKNQILELYLNDVTLGQRGPFEIHGVAEAARIFFGKDVTNLTLPEAATIAGLIQSPSRLSPFRHLDQAQERRNVVLHEMASAGFITAEAAARAAAEPLKIVPRALENEAPYFVDYVSQLVGEQYAGLLQKNARVDVYTTLDLQLQRLAQEALANGILQVDKQLAARKRKGGPAEAALIAVDPRTGEILAFVGGRSYSTSQFDRVISARRQPGSSFKPFVYLAAFEKMAEEGHADLTPATVVVDEPTTFQDGEGNDYNPANYQNDYGGPVTLRDALAHSRNIVAIKVAQATGYDRVAGLWKKVGVGTEAKPYPSIALGVFEASPFEMATAYTIFTNNGSVRPLHAMTRIVEGAKARTLPDPPMREVARPETTFLVVNMMRSVLNEGTAAGARAAGFALDAAGKTGTTNDLRDAWFIGFTPELLTAVWVGLDSNQPIGLSGSQAALPIWTDFMKRALSARPNKPFAVPPGVEFAQVDKLTGKLATPICPVVINEAFLDGTAPKDMCDLHGSNPAQEVFGLFSKLGGWFRRVIH